jgi:hypothetical protein
MFPQKLQPTTFERININNGSLEIPKCIVTFNKWTGQPLKETFGAKAIVDVDGRPMIAELAIMTLFKNDGWQARWVKSMEKRTIMLECGLSNNSFLIVQWDVSS